MQQRSTFTPRLISHVLVALAPAGTAVSKELGYGLKMWEYHVIFLPLSQFPWEEIPRLGDCSSYQCRKKKGRAKERERNKMDYSASVTLPWHMASIPWVPERLSSGVAQASQWLDWGMDWHKYMLSCPFANGRSTIRKERLSVMNYCGIFSKKTLQRLSRVRRCSV